MKFYEDLTKANFSTYIALLMELKSFFKMNFEFYKEVHDLKNTDYFNSEKLRRDGYECCNKIETDYCLQLLLQHPGGKSRYRNDILMKPKHLEQAMLDKEYIEKYISDFKENFFNVFLESKNFKETIRNDYFLIAVHQYNTVVKGVLNIETGEFKINNFCITLNKLYNKDFIKYWTGANTMKAFSDFPKHSNDAESFAIKKWKKEIYPELMI
jgi:hypothetical protein